MNDVEVLARTLYGEARANDTEDAEAIACVVLNRVGYRNWPGTVGEVCLQPWQFSCWNMDDPNRVRIMRAERSSQPWFDQCWQIAERAVAGKIDDRTRSSTHYHTRAVNPRWSRGKSPVFETQGHVFFNNIDTPAPRDAAEALDHDRPLAQSRTVQGGVIAGAATAAGAIYEAAGDVIKEAADAVVPLAAFDGDAVKMVLAAIALMGIGAAVYARFDDRKKGRR